MCVVLLLVCVCVCVCVWHDYAYINSHSMTETLNRIRKDYIYMYTLYYISVSLYTQELCSFSYICTIIYLNSFCSFLAITLFLLWFEFCLHFLSGTSAIGSAGFRRFSTQFF